MLIKIITLDEINNLIVNYFNIKIKVKNIHNLDNIKNKKIIIMANHLNGLDYCIIHQVIRKTNINMFSVAKHNVFGDKNDDNIISNILGLFKDRNYNFFNIIPYIRGDRESGKKTKQMMLKKLNNSNLVLLFPEGEATKSGIPQPNSFKPGSFNLCSENDIYILPITLKYDKKIGVNRNEPINIKK